MIILIGLKLPKMFHCPFVQETKNVRIINFLENNKILYEIFMKKIT